MSTGENRTGMGGFTLVELMIVTVVFGIIVAAALGFMTVQNRAYHDGSDRLLTLQNLRFASQSLEMDLRTLGSNVPAGQPSLVLADEDVIAFSADHTSNVHDFSAVYFDRDADDARVQAPRTSVNLPNSSYSWPDTVYDALGGAPSGAELIIFFFQPDTSTARTDDFVLMRQVNGTTPEVLARNLLNQGSTPFFRYFRRRVYTGQITLDSIPDGELPLFHLAKIHQAADDTAQSAMTDSIRAVRVSFRSTNGRTGDDERFMYLSRVIDLPNSGIEIAGACGDEPILGSTLQAFVFGGSGAPNGTGSVEALQERIDEIREVADAYPGTDLENKLRDATENLLADAMEEILEVPPDHAAVAVKVAQAVAKIQEAIDQGLGPVSLLQPLIDRLTEDGNDDEMYVRLMWNPAVDEESGEGDVVRYLIYRRTVGEGGDWGNPIVSIPAGADSYSYKDATVEQGKSYDYAHGAQDCTPSLSPLSAPQQVTVQ